MLNLDTKIKSIKIIIPDTDIYYESSKYKIGEKIISLNIESKEKIFVKTPQNIKLYCISFDALYCAETQIIAQQYYNCVTTFMIKIPEQFEKIQRRKYIRTKFENKAIISYLENNSLKTIHCKTVDISASGIRLTFDKEVKLPEIVNVCTILNNKKIMINAKFINYYNSRSIQATFEFIDIAENIKEEIIDFCFKKKMQDANSKKI